jgi:hypothetical protein
MGIVRDRLGVEEAELDKLFRAEIQSHLALFCEDITKPMLAELREADRQAGCCGGHGS